MIEKRRATMAPVKQKRLVQIHIQRKCKLTNVVQPESAGADAGPQAEQCREHGNPQQSRGDNPLRRVCRLNPDDHLVSEGTRRKSLGSLKGQCVFYIKSVIRGVRRKSPVICKNIQARRV
jgi:hypothetical protein